MRIDTPDWVVLDYVTYESASLSLMAILEQQQPGLSPSMTIQELGKHPASLSLLDARMVNQSKISDWTARLSAAMPVARMATPVGRSLGWKAIDPNHTMDVLLHAWQTSMQQPIGAIILTWMCSRVPNVAHVVDLRATGVAISFGRSRVTAHISGRELSVRRYQRGDNLPIEAAYNRTTQTLFLLA
jgi:hypothetical protein